LKITLPAGPKQAVRKPAAAKRKPGAKRKSRR
jgi:hypothetical protein